MPPISRKPESDSTIKDPASVFKIKMIYKLDIAK